VTKRDQLISLWHNDLPANHVRDRVHQLFRSPRGCRAGQRRKTRLLLCRLSIREAGEGRISSTVIIDNKPPALPPMPHHDRQVKSQRVTVARSPAFQHVERQLWRRPVKDGSAFTTPSIYVINAAALSKPHATEQLSVDLRNYNIDIAAVTETHFWPTVLSVAPLLQDVVCLSVCL